MTQLRRPDICDLAVRLHPQMRNLARHYNRRYGASETQRPTALVNDAFIKLQHTQPWVDEQHFLAAVALAMRHILVNAARERVALKRGAAAIHVDLDAVAEEVFWDSDDRLVDLNDALEALERLDARLAQVVECRFFGGYSEQETANLLGVSLKTVQRDWAKAKALLSRSLATSF